MTYSVLKVPLNPNQPTNMGVAKICNFPFISRAVKLLIFKNCINCSNYFFISHVSHILMHIVICEYRDALL